MLNLLLFILLCLNCVLHTQTQPVEIVMTMILRDEEVNLRSNLHLWRNIIDYYVFLIDDRTIDNSADVIRSILPDPDAYIITSFQFEGFGQARTESLSVAWHHFPHASHVWVADPDWRPDVSSIIKYDLQATAIIYEFTIFDRNGVTDRVSNWLLRHRAGLRMKYHVHEVLDFDHCDARESFSELSLTWVVREVEQSGSWHTTVGHGHSMSAQRYLFDLSLLEKDLAMYGHDPHTHYYLGATHLGIGERCLYTNVSLVNKHVKLSLEYFTLLVEGRDNVAGITKDIYTLTYQSLGGLFHYFKVPLRLLFCIDRL